jgi:hypothetical protein
VATVTRIDTPLDQTYVRCRSYGHAWDEFSPVDMYAPMYGWRLSLRCIRCQTERHDNMDFQGRVMGRRYIYPDGYAQKGVPKVVFREALFQSLRAKLEKANAIGEEIPEPVRRGRKKALAGV